MTPQEELTGLLKTEAPAMAVAGISYVVLGTAAKLYTSQGGNLANLQRIISLLAIINLQQSIDTTPDLPGPDSLERPLIQKALPSVIPKVVSDLFTKYVPRS